MVECVRGYGCLPCFVLFFIFWTHGGFIALSTSTTAVRRLLYYCCNTWVGGSLRGRHCCTTFCCTAVSGWVDRFVAVITMLCGSPVVSPPLRGLFFFFFLFSPASLYLRRAGIVRCTAIIVNTTPEYYGAL